ncbi:MAG TPA: cupredoxin domain-containing protein [Chthoniobacterales bacterium]|nr:cupredoxin domain-containing protein [Chthoniobacterales bacterium]
MKTIIAIVIATVLSAAVIQADQAQKINVTMSEYHFTMPATAKAGKTTFVVKNTGRKEHAFKIKGEGLEQRLSPDPKPGQTGTLQVDLKPGTYEINCPLPFHTMRGMKTTLTVK